MSDSTAGGPTRGGWPFDPPGSGVNGSDAAPTWPVLPSSGTGGGAPVAPVGSAEPPRPGRGGRRRAVVIAVVAAVVVLVVAGVAVVLLTGKGQPTAVTTRTTVQVSPTPTVPPAAREAASAFLTALPGTVLQFAWSAVTPDADWRATGALEAYSVVYTDGGSVQVTVRAGQWATPAEVAAAQQAVVATLPGATPTADPTSTTSTTSTTTGTAAGTAAGTGTAAGAASRSGDVTVAGAVVGSWVLTPGTGGTGTIVWSNGTTLFAVTAPVGDLSSLYAAFPL